MKTKECTKQKLVREALQEQIRKNESLLYSVALACIAAFGYQVSLLFEYFAPGSMQIGFLCGTGIPLVVILVKVRESKVKLKAPIIVIGIAISVLIAVVQGDISFYESYLGA